jgi:hypothetical protein
MYYVLYVFRDVDLCSVAGGASYKLLVVVTHQPSECKLDFLIVNHLTEKGRALLRKTLSSPELE